MVVLIALSTHLTVGQTHFEKKFDAFYEKGTCSFRAARIFIRWAYYSRTPYTNSCVREIIQGSDL